jgi:hypothetical protein
MGIRTTIFSTNGSVGEDALGNTRNQKVMEALNKVDKSVCHRAANIDKTSVGHARCRRWSRVLGVQEGDNFGTTIAVGDCCGVSNTTNELSSSSWGLGGLMSNSSSIEGRIVQLGDWDAVIRPIACNQRGAWNGHDRSSHSQSHSIGNGRSIRIDYGEAFICNRRYKSKERRWNRGEKRDCETILLFILSLCCVLCRFSVGERELSAS